MFRRDAVKAFIPHLLLLGIVGVGFSGLDHIDSVFVEGVEMIGCMCYDISVNVE